MIRYTQGNLLASEAQALVNTVNTVGVMGKGIALQFKELGCGNGGLQWEKVRAMIERLLSDSPAEIIVYEPNPNIKEELQQSAESKTAKLTPARAMLLYALYQYERQGEAASLFVANKLAYFLQRMGEPLRLKFVPHFYGPYSPQVQHVLYY
ncbi:MAG: phosphatase, partial [Lewinellaceae bacterium]|nr:phosphatase [Lewinellaceae bacterium]